MSNPCPLPPLNYGNSGKSYDLFKIPIYESTHSLRPNYVNIFESKQGWKQSVCVVVDYTIISPHFSPLWPSHPHHTGDLI